MSNINYKELLEDYKDMLTHYCYAVADVPVRKNENGYYVDAELKDCIYVMGGHFDSDYVAEEINEGDFPFEGVDKEGYWHFDFLLKYFRGDEESSYMEFLLSEPSFCISFEDSKKVDEQMERDSIEFEKLFGK